MAVTAKIVTSIDELKEGLFGQVVLFTFEILPYLKINKIYPEWEIKSSLYGSSPDYVVLPGVFDVAYEIKSGRKHKILSLARLRKYHAHVLGGDWEGLSNLWHEYFKMPNHISIAADQFGDLSKCLGVHYRGTDKNKASWDTNPVSQSDLSALVADFLRAREGVTSIFVATDESSFISHMEREFPSFKVWSLGDVKHHKEGGDMAGQAARALLDCLLLSRCQSMLMCSSALSGFAKVLNPNLECYRVSASKMFAAIPYFPAAYIPRIASRDPNCVKILNRLFVDDWLNDISAAKKFSGTFASRPLLSRLEQAGVFLNESIKCANTAAKRVIRKIFERVAIWRR